mgnify:FL=1
MNVRKPVDYGTMYRELTAILTQNLPQMDEVYAIGKAISQRPEKGAAVAAAEFLQANFPDRTGFSPRNVRRMRDFYRTYENDQTLLRLAMKIGWTLNVVIMEAELTSVQRISCLQRAAAERLSKKKLLEIILNDAFAEKLIDEPDEICYNITNAGISGTDQAQFEPPQCRVAGRKRGVVRCGRRKISSLVSYCCSLVSDFLSTVYHFPYLQAWLGSS